MADVKISALPARSAVATTDILPVVDAASGTPATQKATVAQVRAALVPVVLSGADVSGVLPSANAPSHAGDVTGPHTATVVARINGSTVPAGGALTTGNVLQVTGAGALSYGPVNLGGGANYVTGVLPVASVGAPTGTGFPHVTAGSYDGAAVGLTWTGDATGTGTGTSFALTISGLAVSKLAAGSSGQYLQTVGSSPSWVYATQTGGYRTARVVATSNLTLSGTQTIDGTACVAGDRVLAAGQTTGSQNGIYVVAAGAWSYAADWATNLVIPGMRIGISEGTTNGDSSWFLITTGTITVGTTAPNFVRDLASPVTTGNVLQASGGSAVYGAVNLAGGSNYVTGTLPLGNQASPTGTGVPHVVAGVMQAAASLIVNADVSGSAAIAASKVVQATGTGFPHVTAGALDAASIKVDTTNSAHVTVPGTTNGVVTTNGSALQQASGVLAGTNFVSVGASPAASGALRLANATEVNSSNAAATADIVMMGVSSGDNLIIGTASDFASRRAPAVYINPTSSVNIGAGGATYFSVSSASVNVSLPQFWSGPATGDGSASPWGVHGKTTVATTGSFTVAAADYANDALMFTAAAAITATFPLPATNAGAYHKTIIYTGNGTATITNGGGAPKNVVLGPSQTMRCLFDTAGVHPLAGSAGTYP